MTTIDGLRVLGGSHRHAITTRAEAEFLLRLQVGHSHLGSARVEIMSIASDCPRQPARSVRIGGREVSWVELDISSRYNAKLLEDVAGPARFLLDEDTDMQTLLRYFDGQGISANPLPSSLLGKSDEDVREEAWRQDRILLTHDRGFLDLKRHPPESNPGVVVMPGGSGDVDSHLQVIGLVLHMMRPYRPLWRQAYVDIRPSGITHISGVNATTGLVIEPWMLRFNGSTPEMFV